MRVALATGGILVLLAALLTARDRSGGGDVAPVGSVDA